MSESGQQSNHNQKEMPNNWTQDHQHYPKTNDEQSNYHKDFPKISINFYKRPLPTQKSQHLCSNIVEIYVTHGHKSNS